MGGRGFSGCLTSILFWIGRLLRGTAVGLDPNATVIPMSVTYLLFITDAVVGLSFSHLVLHLYLTLFPGILSAPGSLFQKPNWYVASTANAQHSSSYAFLECLFEMADKISRAMTFQTQWTCRQQNMDWPVSLEMVMAFTTLKTKQVVFNLSDKFPYLKLTIDFCDFGLIILNESHLPDNPEVRNGYPSRTSKLMPNLWCYDIMHLLESEI